MPENITWDHRLDQMKGAGIIGFILGFGFLISGFIGMALPIIGLGSLVIAASGVVYVGAYSKQRRRPI